MLKILILAAGIISSLYGVTVLSILGTGGIFNFFYLGLGLFMIAVGAAWKTKAARERRWQKVFLILAGLCAGVFIAVEAAIIACSFRTPPADADYVILLGTQIRADGPSVDYRARLMSAYEYLTDNPGSILVATGGQGENEPVSEAEGAREFLVARGIQEERILLEDRSRNTVQNIRNAYALLTERGEDPSECSVVIVSASYHLLRASFIAENTGFSDIGTKGSTGLPVLMPHFYTREFFALVKDGAAALLDR